MEDNSLGSCVITDSGLNIKIAVKICGLNHLSFFAHLLNLVVTNAIEEDNEQAKLNPSSQKYRHILPPKL